MAPKRGTSAPTFPAPLKFKGRRKIKDTPLVASDDPSANKDSVTFDFDDNEHSLSDWEKLNKLTKSVLSDPSLTAPLPSNKALVERQATFKSDLSSDLFALTTKVREFLLREVIPLTSSVEYGHNDAVEVVDMALGEKPNTASYFSLMRSLTHSALTAKTVVFLADLAGLKGEARTLFILQSLPKDSPQGAHNHLLTSLLSSLQQTAAPEPSPRRQRGSKPTS